MADARVTDFSLPEGWDDTTLRDTPVALDPKGLKVVVAGLGISGWAAADVLAQREAKVVAVDAGASDSVRQHATLLEALGGTPLIGGDAPSGLPDVDGSAPDVVVTSPGWRPDSPLLAEAAERGIPIWSEIELGWRLRQEGAPPWICVTGTNGKTTTVRLISAMLEAGGYKVATVGNVGSPLLDAIVAPEKFDVLVVELSSFQLHFTQSVAPIVSVCLNLADDHLDWHGGSDGYFADKAKVYANTGRVCVFNNGDAATKDMVREADVVDGVRAVGFGARIPAPGDVGLVEDSLCDRAYGQQRDKNATELASLADVAEAFGGFAAPHNVANVLAAAACALGFAAPARCVAAGLKRFAPEPHRLALVNTHDGISYVDDSKATNVHAADAALSGFDNVVWIAGGLAKGAEFGELVKNHAGRLRHVEVIGVDPGPIVEAMRQFAPGVPVHVVESPDTAGLSEHDVAKVGERVMREAIEGAQKAAHDGDTVLLAPACASMDQFKNYNVRGEVFAAQVRVVTSGG